MRFAARACLGAVVAAMACSSVGCVAESSGADDEDPAFASEDTLAARHDGQRPSFVRIRTIDMERQHEWTLVGDGTPAAPEYDAQQVLALISELQPDVLERYTSGDLTEFSSAIPGEPSMSVTSFLRASEEASKPTAHITPRVTLSDYDDKDPEKFFEMTEHLLKFSAGPHPMRHVSLDIWTKFGDDHGWDRRFLVGVFDRLHAQGWTEVGVNLCGAPHDAPLEHLDAWGHADFADVCVSPDTWTPTHHLAELDASKSVHRRLLYIDFPSPMDKFVVLAPDRQASVLTRLAEEQSTERYTLMYPILQLEPPITWDSTKLRTSKDSRWHGQTLFEVMRGLIRRYNTLKPAAP